MSSLTSRLRVAVKAYEKFFDEHPFQLFVLIVLGMVVGAILHMLIFH